MASPSIAPDVADVSGPIRFERPRASATLRAALVLAWVLTLLVAVELPIWLSGGGRLGELATFNHHVVLDGGWAFVPRGHPIADFVGLGTLRRFYRLTLADEGLRVAGVVAMGALTGLGLQQLLGELRGRLGRRREQLALFAWLTAAVVVMRLWLLLLPLAATWIPTAALLVPVVLQLGRRVCLACGLALAVAAAMMVPPFDAVLGLSVGAQATAIAFCTPRRRGGGWRWAPPFMAVSAGVTVFAYLATQLLASGSLHALDLASLEWGRLGGALVAGMIWPLVGLAIDPLFERAVGNLSRSTLLELSDLNNPTLQRISTRAPGTWAHSRAMANLAESAAHAVGADALLVRVGAYYHDLGKADEPQFFIENLGRGVPSPHEGLSPEHSADKIIHHVRASVVRGRAAGLPEPIIDFMHTHHGSGRVEFFYQKARQRAQEAGADPASVDPARFTYPGAKPESPETGILMIVDSVEAASRTLERPDRKGLDGMLRQIVFSKLMTEQLDRCGLSLSDLRRIIETLVETIMASAHDRIAYPWQEEERAQAQREAEQARAQAQASAPEASLSGGRSMPIADGGSGAAPVTYEPSAALLLSAPLPSGLGADSSRERDESDSREREEPSSSASSSEPSLRVVDRGQP